MKPNDDELMGKLKELKVNRTLDPKKKESIKMTIQKHAKKKKRPSKPKSMFIWLAASAIILISGVLLYPTITDDAVLPGDENQPSEETPTGTDDPGNQGGADDSGGAGDDGESDDPSDSPGENKEGNEDDAIQVEELGEETHEIMIEGMEETSTLHLFRLAPYEIDYEIDDILSDYVIVDDSVKHHAEDEDAASFRLSVKEDAPIEEVAQDFEKQYNEDYEDVTEMEQPSDVDSPYSGLSQSAVDTSGDTFDSFVGYYVLQVEEDVIVVEYNYMVEAADGIAPRLQEMVESLRKRE